MSNYKFVGILNAFDKKTEEENVSEETVVVELVQEDTEIELTFSDRNERVYIKFRFADLMRAIGAMEK